MTDRPFVIVGLVLLAAISLTAQQTKTKPYTYEDYCTDNPNASGCVDGKPPATQSMTPQLSQAAGYCRSNAKVAGCEQYCKQNPKAFVCIDTKPQPNPAPPAKAQQPAAPAQPSRNPNDPRFVIVPDPPVEHLPGSKNLSVPASWRFAHPHSDMMMAVNVTALRRSPIAQSLIQQLTARLNITPGELEAAMDKIKGVDHYWVSFNSGDTLFLLQGKMDFPTGFVDLGDGMSCYRISKTAVVLGRQASVTAAVQRLQDRAGAEPADLRQMKELGGEVDLWLQGTRAILSKLKMTAASNAPSSYLLAASFHDGLRIDLQLNYATTDEARRALDTLRSSPISSLHISSEMEDTSVQISFAVDQAGLSNAVGKIMATPQGKRWLASVDESIHNPDPMVVYGLAGGPKALPPSATPPPPPGKMVIYGLPGGPRVL